MKEVLEGVVEGLHEGLRREQRRSVITRRSYHIVDEDGKKRKVPGRRSPRVRILSARERPRPPPSRPTRHTAHSSPALGTSHQRASPPARQPVSPSARQPVSPSARQEARRPMG